MNFDNALIDGIFGWIHPDGTIGANGMMGKYPEIEEFLEEWTEYLVHFPYLDLIVAVTCYNERPDVFPDSTFEDAVEIGIYVHDKKVEILNKEDTLRIYAEYDALYGQPSEKFEPDYFAEWSRPIDVSYLKRCIDSYGPCTEEEWREIKKEYYKCEYWKYPQRRFSVMMQQELQNLLERLDADEKFQEEFFKKVESNSKLQEKLLQKSWLFLDEKQKQKFLKQIEAHIQKQYISHWKLTQELGKTIHDMEHLEKWMSPHLSHIEFMDRELYLRQEVYHWLQQQNKIPTGNDVIKEDTLCGKGKHICFTGANQIGKAAICASFAKSELVPHLRKIFAENDVENIDDLLQIHFKRNAGNYVKFYYGDGSGDSVPIAIHEGNVQRIRKELQRCAEKVNPFIQWSGEGGIAEEVCGHQQSNTVLGTKIAFFLEPNLYLLGVMNRCNLDYLTFHTIGRYNEINRKMCIRTESQADVIVSVFGDVHTDFQKFRDADDAREAVSLLGNLHQTDTFSRTGPTESIFLYVPKDFALDEKDCLGTTQLKHFYNAHFQITQQKVLQNYEQVFQGGVRKNVAFQGVPMGNMIESLVCVPNFEQSCQALWDLFCKKFCKKLQKALTQSRYLQERKYFEGRTLPDKFFEIYHKQILSIAKTFPFGKEYYYGISQFMQERHGRTKDLDQGRLDQAFCEALYTLKKHLHNQLALYQAEDCDAETAAIVRMVYLTLFEGLRNDCSYGYSKYHREMPDIHTQMLCEEILSEKLLDEDLRKKHDEEYRKYAEEQKEEVTTEQLERNHYWRTLREEGNIQIGSWDSLDVELDSTDWGRAKLVVSQYHNLPSEIKTRNLRDYIIWCHFIPSLLIQAVLAYKRMTSDDWDKKEYDTYISVMDRAMLDKRAAT